jgi:hypothetical protein
LIPSRIRKVLSTMARHRVRALLMGGQACVFYGAAEFSRDADLLVLGDTVNMAQELIRERPLLRFACQGRTVELSDALLDEERDERQRDRAYWMPLKAELEHLRQLARGSRDHTQDK